MDSAIIVLYLAGMVAFGWWGKRKTNSTSDYLVAGRRLGPALYTCTMSAMVIGGASTLGGVGLGYQYGLSGMWLVTSIGVGVLVLGLCFAARIQRLKIYTVSEMLQLRYGSKGTAGSGLVMLAYTLMLTTTSTVAYATIFTVMFDMSRITAVVIGGLVVVAYSSMGGMWAITLTDMVQFILKSVGIFALLLPFTWNRAGGLQGMSDRLDDSAFSLTTIGGGTIVTYFVVYSFGMIIGQDAWQRIFTARSPQVARWGGAVTGIYCLLYGLAGALIGMGAKVIMPNISVPDDVYADIAFDVLPVGISGIVLAAAVAAMMSTASGSLLAAATVCRADVMPIIRRALQLPPVKIETSDAEADVRGNRAYVVGLGVISIGLSIAITDIIAALTIAYDILVGGLLVAIVGGLVWKRGTAPAATSSMLVGAATTLITMWIVGDITANEPIYAGLIASLAVYVVVSLLTPHTDAEVARQWAARVSASTTRQAEDTQLAEPSKTVAATGTRSGEST
ncbi:sodium:solute symporter [Streptomyces sp. NPDC052042]|uniref:sodium:solute symporter n=1 Tax=Streptomyces sp. NPDC052042 TaxID=3365683 RepID=UPI0037D2373C